MDVMSGDVRGGGWEEVGRREVVAVVAGLLP